MDEESMTRAPIRVLVVDDEPLARRGLIRMLQDHDGFEVIGECSNGGDAINAIRNENIDLILLDVEMPEHNGFEVLQLAGMASLPLVIFVTAFDRYALKAFDAHALDYVVKPVDPDRFHQALERAKVAIQNKEAGSRLQTLIDELDQSHPNPKCILTRAGGLTSLIPVEEIDWLQAADNYVRVHAGNQVFLHRETLSRLADRLHSNRFVRIHRSHIVNLDRVHQMRLIGRGDAEIQLLDGTKLTVSRRFRKNLEDLFPR